MSGFVSFKDVIAKDESGKNTGFVSFNQKKEEPKEGFLKSSARTATQIPQGILEGTAPGLMASFWQLLAHGEALDPAEIDRLEENLKQWGIPFDREKYMEAAQQALSHVPTVSNIARITEEQTGIPLEPKSKLDKFFRLGSMAATAQPGNLSPSGKIQPATLAKRTTAGVVAPTVKTGLEEAGVPEPIAELVGLGAGGIAGAKTPITAKTKPSGLTARRFEETTKPTEISESRLGKLHEKVENDFRNISDQIIIESPVGETARNLKNDPTYKQQSRELLEEAQNIANSLTEEIPGKSLKKEQADLSKKNTKGFAPSEYDKGYSKFTKEMIEEIPETLSPGQAVEQYRKNNKALGEYFEPGSSKALNRAKRDAILDQNRAIAKVIEKTDPHLAKVFREGNERWTKIMDAEAVDAFVNEIFAEKVNYKKMHDFFDKSGYDRIFKRALGENGYKQFEQLVKDMLESEAAYKMLKVAKEKGFSDLYKTGMAYMLHPKAAIAHGGFALGKNTFKSFMNSLLDKPQLTIKWRQGVNELKKGDFKAAEKTFNELSQESIKLEELRVNSLEKFNEKVQSTKHK